MIWKKDIYEYCKIDHPNGIRSFLEKVGVKIDSVRYFDMLIGYLLKVDGWLDHNDFKVLTLDTNRELWFFKDGVYRDVDERSVYNIEYGFLFEDKDNIRRSPKIDKKESFYNLGKIHIEEHFIKSIDLEKMVFIYDPICGYMNNNTRMVYKFIKWKYKIIPEDFIYTILNTLGYKKCKTCKLYYKNIEKRCSACEKKHVQKESIDVRYILKDCEKRDFITNMLGGVCPICGSKNFKPQHIMRHIFKKHKITYKNLINDNFNEKCSCGENKVLFDTWAECVCFNKELSEFFYDFDFEKDFLLFRHTCNNNKCANNDMWVTFKKIFTFYKNKGMISDIDELRYYKNLHDDITIYKLKCLLSEFRNFNNKSINSYKGFEYETYSNLEQEWSKKIIDFFNPNVFYTNWDISKIYPSLFFQYIQKDKQHVYIPDFYVETNYGNFIIEVKSNYTCGLSRDHLEIMDKDRLLNVFLKLQSIKKCDSNLVILVIIDKKVYSYDGFKNKLWELCKGA